jgi:protein arginine kinase activator
MLAELTKSHSAPAKENISEEMTCPNCGISYNEFQAKGRFGCANDYQEFREELYPLIERIHGRTQHVGKIPLNSEVSTVHRDIMNLQKEMRAAVENEDYEKAAELRDKINSLKQEIEK